MELLLHLLKWSMIVGAAALALTLLKPLLDRRYSAKWRYGAWLVMAVFLLLAPMRWENAAPQVPVAPAVVIEVPQVEVSVSREDGVSFQRPKTAGLPAASVPAASAVKSKTFPLEELLITLWVTGGALFLLYYALGTWFFTRRARRWSRCADEETLRVFHAVCQDMGLKRPPALRVSSAVSSPMMVGLFRAALLLPGEEFRELELAFILRHELTHHRRHDLWYKLLLALVNALHWFNPLVYLLRREAERDLELTCDDAVVAGTGAEVRRAYSETLLSSLHRQKGLGRAVLSTHFYGGKEVMKERFRNILGKRGRKRGVLVLVAVLTATVAAACAFGLQTSGDVELSAEELAEWEIKVNSPDDLRPYLWCMYSDTRYIPSEECMECIYYLQQKYNYFNQVGPDVSPDFRVLSGTKNGDMVTLELEGEFSTGLSTGTLTLENGVPVSFTNPLYTAVESAALELMERDADYDIGLTNAMASGPLEFTEKYITELFCTETIELDGKTYYGWELFYAMKPNDISNVVFAGGMADENGWLTEQQSMGRPVIIASVDADGNVAVEHQTYTGSVWEAGYTWEEYIYCRLVLPMNNMSTVLNGWPEISTPFLESLRDGHETWAMDWQDTALSYLSTAYNVYPDSGLKALRTFQADEQYNAHDQSVLVRGTCGDRTVTLWLAHVCYPVEVWNTTMRFWQVVGERWESDIPEDVQEFMNAYLEAFKEGTDVSVKFVYFPEEYANFYDAHRNSGDKLLSYEIRDIRQVNDALYAFHMYYVTEAHSDEAYTFVARIDDEYRIILNTTFLPEELKQGINESDFYIEPPPFVQELGIPEVEGNGDGMPTAGTELAPADMAALTSYFNATAHNGLLRAPYHDFSETIPYMEIILYDMGISLSGTEERRAVVDAFFDGTDPDCDISRLTREMVENFFAANFPVNLTEAEFNGYWKEMQRRMIYLESYDAFYLVHGDTMMNNYMFDRAVWNDDNTVSVYYTTDLWQYDGDGELDLLWEQPMCAILIPVNPDGFQGWLTASNQAVE